MTPSDISLDLDPTLLGQTAAGIRLLCRESLALASARLDEIRALRGAAAAELRWETTFERFDDVALALSNAGAFAQLMAVAHPEQSVREAAQACEPEVEQFQTSLYLDPELFAVFERYEQKHEPLPPDRARLVAHTLRDYRRNGLRLDASGQQRLRTLNEEITKLSQAFETNLAASTLSIDVAPDQLAGLPPAYVDAHAPGPNGMVTITTDYPDAFPFLQYARDRKAALALAQKFETRAAAENVPLLERLLALRSEKAQLLGYATWADYVLEPRMARTANHVADFLEQVRQHVRDRSEEELRQLRAMQGRLGGDPNGPVLTCDRTYLEDRLRQETYGLDSQKLSEYFEVGRVRDGLLALTARMYGITYKPAASPVWHEDVTAFDVIAADGSPVGRFYFDLFPRPGKFKHAAVFGIRPAKRLADGTRLRPMAAIVCNFPPVQAGRPALLSHGDVVTFFHEFGHVLHDLFSTTDLASFSGTQVARDFVEAPSQMFEEWAWARETLNVFARHYATGAPLPDELYEAMQRSRTFGRALGTGRQLFLSALDQTYHTRPPGFDSTAVLREVHEAYSSFTPVEGSRFQATFGHLIGYDAGYYGYQWALALARDLFTRFAREGLLQPSTATAYRESVLAPGGGEEEVRLVERFLGRPPNNDAYLRYLSGEG